MKFTFLLSLIFLFLATNINSQSRDTITTNSGLKYFLTKNGNGKEIDTGSVVVQHYTVWLSNGEILDSTRDLNIPFAYEHPKLIKGSNEALSLMKVGDRGIFIMPYYLAYGEKGDDEIPPKETLTFDIEVLDVKKHFLSKVLLRSLFDESFKTDSIPKVKEAIIEFQQLKKEGFLQLYVDQYELNAVGYELIEKFPNEALVIFKQNIIEYPDESNPYDSLGDCYMKLGENEHAIVNFKKALKIDPKRSNTQKKLKELTNN